MRSHIKLLLVTGTIAFAYFVWLAYPVAGFFGYRGGYPLPPWGWVELPSETPVDAKTFDDRYVEAGVEALSAITSLRAEIGAPAISAAVAIEGNIVWSAAVGWADIANEAAATTATKFRIGSTSKALTGTALARMATAGAIDIDVPIATYFPSLPNESWAEITARQLASHMAGIPHYEENTDMVGLYHTAALRKEYDSVTDALSVFDDSEVLFEPGTAFHYSTLGTVLLGATMSYAANSSYRDIMNTYVFGPLGLEDTIVAPAQSEGRSDYASSYLLRDERYRKWRRVDLTHRLPGGGFASTPSDLVLLGSSFLDDSFISPAIRQEFWTPQILADGSTNHQNYAIGWRVGHTDVENIGAVRAANHGGVSRGAQCWLVVFPDLEMSIAFTINTNTDKFHDFGMVYKELLRIFGNAAVNNAQPT